MPLNRIKTTRPSPSARTRHRARHRPARAAVIAGARFEGPVVPLRPYAAGPVLSPSARTVPLHLRPSYFRHLFQPPQVTDLLSMVSSPLPPPPLGPRCLRPHQRWHHLGAEDFPQSLQDRVGACALSGQGEGGEAGGEEGCEAGRGREAGHADDQVSGGRGGQGQGSLPGASSSGQVAQAIAPRRELPRPLPPRRRCRRLPRPHGAPGSRE